MASELHRRQSEDSIRVHCPGCGKVLRTARRYAGQTRPCPQCYQPVTIPEATAGRSGALPVAEPVDDRDVVTSRELAESLRGGGGSPGVAPGPGFVEGVRAGMRRWRAGQELRGIESALRARLVAAGHAAIEAGHGDVAADTVAERQELHRVLGRIREQGVCLEALAACRATWAARQSLRRELEELHRRRDELLARIGEAAVVHDAVQSAVALAVGQLRARAGSLRAEVGPEGTSPAEFARRALGRAARLAMAAGVIGLLAWGGLGLARSALRGGQAPIRTVDGSEVGEAVGMVVAGARISGPDGRRYEAPMSTGTAFAVTPEGHLVTNRHVVEKVWNLGNAPLTLKALRERRQIDLEPTLWVFFQGKKHVARILHVSERYDLALLKVERAGGPFYAVASRDDPGRGTATFSLGFPGISRAVTGEGDAIERTIREQTRHSDVGQYFMGPDFEYVEKSGSVSRLFAASDGIRWVEHNADINHGNSGGPLVDGGGRVVGVNTLGANPSEGHGTYFSFPLAQCRDEIEAHVPGLVWE
ncbi:MAG: serine protease [Isosphaeraceae bacterium]